MKNVCNTDRVLRIIIGIGLLALALLYDGPGGGLGWIGIVPLVTGLLGFCPLYAVLGVNCRIDHRKPPVSSP